MLDNKEIEECIKIVGPLAVMIGLTEDDTRNLINFVDEMRNRGISGADGGLLLRQYLQEYQNVQKN